MTAGVARRRGIELVNVAYFLLPCGEKGKQIAKTVVCRLCEPLLHLIFELLLPFNLQEPFHHHLRLSGCDLVDAVEVLDDRLDCCELRAQVLVAAKLEGIITNGFQLLGVEYGGWIGVGGDKRNEVAQFDVVKPQIGVFQFNNQLVKDIIDDRLAKGKPTTFLGVVGLLGGGVVHFSWVSVALFEPAVKVMAADLVASVRSRLQHVR